MKFVEIEIGKVKIDVYNKLAKFLRKILDKTLKGEDWYEYDILDDILKDLNLEKEKQDEKVPCSHCGQVDMGQTGEYPCPVCGLPTVWDEREKK